MARSYFQVYLSYEDPLKSLTYEQIGKIFMAMFQYEKTKEKPDLDPVSDMAFCFIRSQMERDQQAYEEKCERSRQNGMKGGRPRKSEKSRGFLENQPVFSETPKNKRFLENQTVFLETQKSQGEGEGKGKGEEEGEEYIKKDISNEISQKDRFPYKEITDLYNRICTELPACVKLSEARKKAIRARLVSGYTVDDFKTLFQKTKESSFLTGGNNRNWIAGFDWLIRDGNMAKVLEGNYDDRSMGPRTKQEQKAPLPVPKSIYKEL